jgi:5'(3')-deoxyribonucleotidase
LKPKRIFLDLDDVLNEFTMSTLSEMCPYFGEYKPEWGWDIVRACNESHGQPPLSVAEFWDSFDREHWVTRPKSDMCDWLIARCVALVGSDNVHILTSPTKDPDCLAGKLEWIHANLPGWLHRQYLIGPDKSLCASPDSLLIDDRDKNVGGFREAGGQAILVPRPWNEHGTQFHAQQTVRFWLAKIFDVGY